MSSHSETTLVAGAKSGPVGEFFGYLPELVLACSANLLALFFSYPHLLEVLPHRLMVRMSDLYRPGDMGGTLFLVARSVEGESGSRSQFLAWPDGIDFQSDFSNRVVTDIMGRFVGFLGMPLGFNVSIVAMLVTNGLAVHLSARLLGARPLAAFAGGMMASTAPLMMEEVLSGRPVTAWWAPALLATALCVRALRRGRALWMIVPGLACLFLSIRIYAFEPVLLLPWTLLAGLLAIWPLRWNVVARAILVLSLGAWVTWWASRSPVEEHGLSVIMPRLSQISLSLPDLFDATWGDENLRRVPVTLWIAAVAASLMSIPSIRKWFAPAVAALGLLVVALGPSLYGTSDTAPVETRMPYVGLLASVKVLWACPRPTRYALPGVLMLALWMSMALSCLLVADAAFRRWAGRLACFSVIILGTFQVHTRDSTNRYPSWPPFPQIRFLEGDAVLLDLPITFQDDKVPFALFAYLPIPRLNPWNNRFSGWLVRLEARDWPLLYCLTLVQRDLQVPHDLKRRLAGGDSEIQEIGLRHVVLHKTVADPGRSREWLDLLSLLNSRTVLDDHWIKVLELDSNSREPVERDKGAEPNGNLSDGQ